MMMGEEKVNEKNVGVLAEIKIKQKYEKQVDDAIMEEDESISESDDEV